jgi:3',5'-cyclic AMP phosphodiesterase CpdA
MLTLLHLSDLHITTADAGTQFDRDSNIRDALLADLGRDGRTNFDAILITGDIACPVASYPGANAHRRPPCNPPSRNKNRRKVSQTTLPPAKNQNQPHSRIRPVLQGTNVPPGAG